MIFMSEYIIEYYFDLWRDDDDNTWVKIAKFIICIVNLMIE